MKRGLSTGKPTKRETARIVACKEGPCMACMVLSQKDGSYKGWSPLYGCDYHHLLSGGKRRGHRFGVGLCPWHHRGVVDFDSNAAEMRRWAGPSLMDGSRLFHETYGSDDELLAIQDRLIGWAEE